MDQPATSNSVAELRDRLRIETNEIRNQKRFAEYSKKRLHLDEVVKELQDVPLAEVHCLAKAVKRSRSNEVETLRKLNKAFSQGEEFISAFLGNGGALQGLIGLLTCQDAESQLEAAGCIINLLTANHRTTKSVAKAASPYLITYLSSSSVHLQELSAWALGNIAADCATCATALKNQDFVPLIIPLLQSPRTRVIHSAVYALSSFVKSVPHESCSILEKGLGLELPKLLVALRGSTALTDLLILLFRLSTMEQCDAYLVKANCVEEIFRTLQDAFDVGQDHSRKTQAITLAIRTLANISSGEGVCSVISVREAGNCFHQLLHFPIEHVVKETLWLLANIASYDDDTVKDFFSTNQVLISSTYTKLSNKLPTPLSTVEQALVFLCNVKMSLLDQEVQPEVIKSRLADLFLLMVPRPSHETIARLSSHLSLLIVEQAPVS